MKQKAEIVKLQANCEKSVSCSSLNSMALLAYETCASIISDD